MKKYSAALLAGSMLLAGCGGDSTASSTKGSSPPTTAKSPTTVSPASPTTPAASVPAPGAAHTKAGSQFFSLHFFEQVNRAWMTPNPKALDGLYAPTCKTCAAIRGSAAEYASKSQRYRDTPLTRMSASSITGTTAATTQVRVTAMQEASAVVNRDGKVVEAVPRTPSAFVLTLTWVNGGWLVSLMQVRA